MQTRSFQYVTDLVEGVYRLLMSSFTQPVNIGTTEEMTIVEFAERVNTLTANKAGVVFQKSERMQGDPQQRRPDPSRARTVLDWTPQVTLAEGLPKTVDYFREVVWASEA